MLEVTGLAPLIEARVDGVVAKERGLPGKPKPDTFVEGARMLGAEPAQSAVFEDALAGVEAGRAGDFGAVIGVDREDGDQWVAAFVVCADGITDDALRDATGHLESFKRPQRVVRLPDSYHLISIDVERDRVADEVAIFLERRLGPR